MFFYLSLTPAKIVRTFKRFYWLFAQTVTDFSPRGDRTSHSSAQVKTENEYRMRWCCCCCAERGNKVWDNFLFKLACVYRAHYYTCSFNDQFIKSSEDAPPLPAAKSTEDASAAETATAVDNPDAIPEVWLCSLIWLEFAGLQVEFCDRFVYQTQREVYCSMRFCACSCSRDQNVCPKEWSRSCWRWLLARETSETSKRRRPGIGGL